jgi:HPt (histidine-containing phosphotransfer) domain-containing protein
MGNLDFATRAVARFRQDFAGGLAELRQAADEAASERVATIAHRLKGAAAMIAAHRLQEVSAEIESLGRNRDPDQISCRLDALEGEWARFVDNVAL